MADSVSPALDLYAKVEDLLGVKEAAPTLYAHYLLFLQTLEFETLLDVGCGSGDFLRQMQGALEIPSATGIDLSPLMVSKTREQGFEAECMGVCEVEGSFDVITAVFDMLNYLDATQLKDFLACINSRLNAGGYFVCDTNTLYGFENVAVGAFIVDDEKRFLTIDSDFEAGDYFSTFTLFEQEGTCFSKSQESIRQTYHTPQELIALIGLELIASEDVFLYGFEEADKTFFVFRKTQD
ncbi:MAG: methyltransferase type 12 [Sulfurovum sp. 28-43-6]|nr:MAG: methyltransferase type 12 [Sulfurovum sp. 28-43-6]